MENDMNQLKRHHENLPPWPSSSRTNQPTETTESINAAPAPWRPAASILLPLAIAAMTCLVACDLPLNQSSQQAPMVGGAEPVVVEETVVVDFEPPPYEVEYVYVGDRYCYWHPGYDRWLYRPAAWTPPPTANVRHAASLGELKQLHQSGAGPGHRAEAGQVHRSEANQAHPAQANEAHAQAVKTAPSPPQNTKQNTKTKSKN